MWDADADILIQRRDWKYGVGSDGKTLEIFLLKFSGDKKKIKEG